eukprot:GHRR01033516.1.p1 GENE.GHRR01033516.1~~GHRR01033516.1.p1  ORF type:complete len:184 (-),score=40.37 GHRR01033516.1:63-614(-)
MKLADGQHVQGYITAVALPGQATLPCMFPSHHIYQLPHQSNASSTLASRQQLPVVQLRPTTIQPIASLSSCWYPAFFANLGLARLVCTRTMQNHHLLQFQLLHTMRFMLQPTAVFVLSSMPALLKIFSHSLRVLHAPPGHWARISIENRPAACKAANYKQQGTSYELLLNTSMVLIEQLLVER